MGVGSLQNALHRAGARMSLACLWDADDAHTPALMREFYRRLWIEGVPAPDALWQAKTALRERGAPMRAWAGWVLTGATP